MTEQASYDVILVGGGLANGLLAWRLHHDRPALRVLLLEQGATLGGNHTWSFHTPDVTPRQLDWLRPFLTASWDRYQVRFPAFTRDLPSGYHSIVSEQFHRVLLTGLKDIVRLHADVTEVTETSVCLGGETLQATAVLDGRGQAPTRAMIYAWQKFLGLEIETATPHGLTQPIIMDATVAQHDGYRFVYTLPLSATRLLIEDTRYSDTSAVDAAEYEACLQDYAAGKGWTIQDIVRREIGVLPITLSGDFKQFWQEAPRHVPVTGARAGLFHPTTGYSLPDAVRLAERLAALDDMTPKALRAAIVVHAAALWRQQGFFRILNRMLFYAARPAQRYQVLQRFYRLPAPLISRFYAGCLHGGDIVRILFGKPPVPVWQAFRAMLGTQSSTTGPTS